MAGYLALQIRKGMLTYQKVMTKFSSLKEEIDHYLRLENREDLIEEINMRDLQK